MKISFILANSADPDEISHSVAFHLGFHCLLQYIFRHFQYTDMYALCGLSNIFFDQSQKEGTELRI